ncbi:MAG: cysteine hydrolase [Erysipelotrichales bacterium]|nr:cysteine hydrolase [Erysipelotrichales bacterium]
MKRLLIVVDYQNDFVNGSLGFEDAPKLENTIVKYIQDYQNNGDDIIYTMDTHQENYMESYEGQKLPVAHCIKNTEGWQLYGQTKNLLRDCLCFEKPTFPSLDLANYLKDKEYKDVTLVGLVSHICVISNAIMVKAALPETPIYIDMKATSSVDQLTHQKSIDVMKSLHIDIIQ